MSQLTTIEGAAGALYRERSARKRAAHGRILLDGGKCSGLIAPRTKTVFSPRPKALSNGISRFGLEPSNSSNVRSFPPLSLVFIKEYLGLGACGRCCADKALGA
ncbi:hypothetical protein KM043_014603 [Ampulex compressa]|nr:hypothetical protein KM043_014603 [Ampulex compressa]